MSSSLRKLFTSVWSFLKGTLHPHENDGIRHLVYLDSPTMRENERAISALQEALGYENVTIMAQATEDDARSTLCVRATAQELAEARERLPFTTTVIYHRASGTEVTEPFSRRVHGEF